MKKFIKILGLGLITEQHVDFEGTIDGWSYFARTFRIIPGFLVWMMSCALLLGIPMFLSSIALLIALSISTQVKRYRAVFPKWDPWTVWAVAFVWGIISGGVSLYLNGTVTHVDQLKPWPPILWMMSAISWGFSLYVIFKNTNLKHEG